MKYSAVLSIELKQFVAMVTAGGSRPYQTFQPQSVRNWIRILSQKVLITSTFFWWNYVEYLRSPVFVETQCTVHIVSSQRKQSVTKQSEKYWHVQDVGLAARHHRWVSCGQHTCHALHQALTTYHLAGVAAQVLCLDTCCAADTVTYCQVSSLVSSSCQCDS